MRETKNDIPAYIGYMLVKQRHSEATEDRELWKQRDSRRGTLRRRRRRKSSADGWPGWVGVDNGINDNIKPVSVWPSLYG